MDEVGRRLHRSIRLVLLVAMAGAAQACTGAQANADAADGSGAEAGANAEAAAQATSEADAQANGAVAAPSSDQETAEPADAHKVLAAALAEAAETDRLVFLYSTAPG